jgi:hypothetical protein
MAWQRMRVQLKGEGEPIEVQTNARDWAAVVIDPNAPKALDMTFRVAHAALKRCGHEVPRDYDSFLEILESLPETIDADDDTSGLDPIPQDR